MAKFSSDKTVQSLPDLIEAVSPLRGDYRWLYRGHGNVKWKLVPKAGRSREVLGREWMYVEAWKRRAIQFVHTSPSDNWDWLALAQHHGFPTRLLDWSTNPLVGAYFAAAESPSSDGAVFAFLPRWLTPWDKCEPYEYRGLSCYRPRAVADRVSPQQSQFTVHGPPDTEIADDENMGELQRIVIPSECKEELRHALDHVGIHESSLFPGLDGLSRHLNWIISQRDLRDQILNEPIPHGSTPLLDDE